MGPCLRRGPGYGTAPDMPSPIKWEGSIDARRSDQPFANAACAAASRAIGTRYGDALT